MNKILNTLLTLLIMLPLSGFSQITLIPDSVFEQQLINLGYDTQLDGYVNTQHINNIDSLDVSSKNISDLTGIEDFTNLNFLRCDLNNLTTLDVSYNNNLLWISCTYNQLTNLEINQAVTTLLCYGNNLTNLNTTQSPYLEDLKCGLNQLTTLDLSYNFNLKVLSCAYNKLTTLDISNCPQLFVLSCTNNELTELNLRNGNNINFGVGWPCGLGFYCSNNPYLTCIMVDNPSWSTLNWLVDSLQIDTQHYFSNNCETTTTIIEEYTTPKNVIQIVDIWGRETEFKRNVPLFYIYDDGTIEKKIIIQ